MSEVLLQKFHLDLKIPFSDCNPWFQCYFLSTQAQGTIREPSANFPVLKGHLEHWLKDPGD